MKCNKMEREETCKGAPSGDECYASYAAALNSSGIIRTDWSFYLCEWMYKYEIS